MSVSHEHISLIVVFRGILEAYSRKGGVVDAMSVSREHISPIVVFCGILEAYSRKDGVVDADCRYEVITQKIVGD